MTQYRGLYIDHVYYNSKADIDEAIKQREINNYKMRCEIFAMRKTMEASIFADQQAEILHNEFGISWEELERIETERVCKINCVYLHRLFDTPIFRTKKCFRQYCE